MPFSPAVITPRYRYDRPNSVTVSMIALRYTSMRPNPAPPVKIILMHIATSLHPESRSKRVKDFFEQVTRTFMTEVQCEKMTPAHTGAPHLTVV